MQNSGAIGGELFTEKIDRMKRYLLFGGSEYYPGGGMDDFINDFDIIEDAVAHANTLANDWQQLYDQVDKKHVWSKWEGYVCKP